MKTLLRILLVVGVLVCLAVPAYLGGAQYWKLVTRTKWRTAEVENGEIVSVVNSTGSVKPKMQVTVGSFVSGPLLPEYTTPEEAAAENAQASAWLKDNADWLAMLPDNERVDPYDYTRVGVPLPDFNHDVQVGMLLAKIDPLLYWANVNRDAAALQNRIADVQRVKALLQQAINDERRALDLRAEDKTFIAQATACR
jgi:HlyD family secretion protein